MKILFQVVFLCLMFQSSILKAAAYNDDDLSQFLENENLLHPDTFKTFKNKVENGHKLSLDMLYRVLLRGHYNFVEFILTKLKLNVLDNDSFKEQILIILLRLDDPEMNRIVLARIPNLRMFTNADTFESILLQAVDYGRNKFVDFLLEVVEEIRSDILNNLLKKALKTYNLRLIERLTRYSGSHLPYPQILGLQDLSEDELETHIFRYAMHSPLPMIYDLASNYIPSIQSFLPSLLSELSLLVRFPDRRWRFDGLQQEIEEYVQVSRNYAQENSRLLDDILSRGPEFISNRVEVLNHIVNNRVMRLERDCPQSTDNQAYSRRAGPEDEYNNKVGSTPMTFVIANDYKLINRYGYVLRHFFRIQSAFLETVHIINTGIVFTYSFDDSSHSRIHIPMTQLANMKWHHNAIYNTYKIKYSADSNELDYEKFMEHWADLHRHIMEYSLVLQDSENRNEFFRLVAKAYWLNATACEMLRGTPHNAMMWLNLVYRHHRLPPPIPRLEYFFLDNLMLVVPVEYAVDHWEEFFEPNFEVPMTFQSNINALFRALFAIAVGSSLHSSIIT